MTRSLLIVGSLDFLLARLAECEAEIDVIRSLPELKAFDLVKLGYLEESRLIFFEKNNQNKERDL